ncbi:hypothetical protein Tco_0119889 [Tanacetum coccineum]
MVLQKGKTDFVTPTKASGEAQEEEISPTILEAAKTLSKVASQSVSKAKSTDKGKRYRRRVRSMAKKIDTGLHAMKKRLILAEKRLILVLKRLVLVVLKLMVLLVKGVKGKERLQCCKLNWMKKLQSNKMIAKRMIEEEALTEQQKKRKAQVQFEARFYTEEDWDTIRAKLEANAELSKDVLGQDFAKRMAEIVNQRKKHFAEERAKAKRNKPMTQSQLRIYMSNYLKNRGT